MIEAAGFVRKLQATDPSRLSTFFGGKQLEDRDASAAQFQNVLKFMATVLSNVSVMRHEALKAAANNLRG